MTSAEQVHATCVTIGGKAVLIRGKSGSGKSDLALSLIDRGAELLADDRTDLRAEGGRIIASCPDGIAGLFEVRGIGIVRLPAAEPAPVALVVELTPPDKIERMPERRAVTLLGIDVPILLADAFHASTPAKIRLALRLDPSAMLAT